MTDSPGWDAITKQLSAVYGEQEPRHVGSIFPSFMPEAPPLRGISAYRSERVQPHWHLVTYGLTDLFAGQPGATVSGNGIELTMRLARAAAETEPPVWVLNFLQNIARYIRDSGNAILAGHHLDANGPISLDTPTKLVAIAALEDPELPGQIPSPNGAFRFVQLVGITRAEFDEIVIWRTEDVLRHLQTRDALLITDLVRDDFHGDAAIARAVREESARHPAATEALHIPQVEVRRVGWLRKKQRLVIGALVVGQLSRLLPKRITHGLELALLGGSSSILLHPAGVDPRTPSSITTLAVSADAARAFESRVPARAGVYELAPGVEVEVVRSEIRDGEGRVVRVVG